jgi:hypothetical protein
VGLSPLDYLAADTTTRLALDAAVDEAHTLAARLREDLAVRIVNELARALTK